jgi:DNA polymerase III delta prime subunit
MTILYEKYRPKSLEEFCGHEPIILELKKWLGNYFLPKTKNDVSKANVIIMGTPGIGKTTLAHILLTSFGFDVIELNASDTRNGDQIDNIFKETLKSTNNVVSMLNYEKKKIGIIMDEIDGLSTGDKGGMKRLQYFLQKNDYFCPIILTSNIAHYTLMGSKKLVELKKNCLFYSLDPVPSHIIYKKIYSIVDSEKLTEVISPPFLNLLIQNSNSDFRIILNTIEFTVLLSKTGKLDFTNMLEFVKNNSKDVNYDLFQATEKLFKANSFKNESDIFNMFDLERYNLPLTSYDNLYKYINTFDSENLETIQNILHKYTDSIFVENSIYNGLHWELFEAQCSLTIYTVYTLFTFIKNKGTRSISNSKVSSRMNCINANRDTRAKITKSLGIDRKNYHLYIEYLIGKVLKDPEHIKYNLEENDLPKEEMLRLLRSADCKTHLLQRLNTIGFITEKELEKSL